MVDEFLGVLLINWDETLGLELDERDIRDGLLVYILNFGSIFDTEHYLAFDILDAAFRRYKSE